MQFTVTQAVEASRVADLLCSAFEGGSDYWAVVVRRHAPTEWKYTDMDGRHYVHLIPLNPGGLIVFQTDDNEYHNLDQAALQRGLQVMAEKYPEHYADFLAENDDAATGDVFLQCCLFGEVIYG